VVSHHLESFFSDRESEGMPLPQYITNEFEAALHLLDDILPLAPYRTDGAELPFSSSFLDASK
jgi:hypothetical protein